MVSHQDSPPSVIVDTILNAFFRSRGLTLAGRGLSVDTEPPTYNKDGIVADMEQFGYVRIDALRARGARGARDWVVILVLAGNKKCSNNSPDFRKLLDGLDAERPTKEGRLDEVIVVAEQTFFEKKNLTEVIRDAQHKKQAGGPDLGGKAPFYNVYPYRNFTFAIPEHESVFPHRIMAADEVELLLSRERISISDLPVIFSTDPAIVWNGGRSGQVVEIKRDSPTAGTSFYYRRIAAMPP